MRKSFQDLFKEESTYYEDIHTLFSNFHNEDEEFKDTHKDFIKEYIFLELYWYGCAQLIQQSSFNKYEPFALFSNHENLLYQQAPIEDSLSLKIYTFLLNKQYAKLALDDVMIFYFSLPDEYRLFEIDESFKTVTKKETKPKYNTDREHIYQSILADVKTIQHKETDERWLTVEEIEKNVTTFSSGYEQQRKVKHVFSEDELRVPHYYPMTELVRQRIKEKKGYQDLNRYLPTEATYEAMGNSYPQRFRDMKMHEVNGDGSVQKTSSSFTFDTYNHVAGPLGAGKSTFVNGLLVSLVGNSKKALVFTSSTVGTFRAKRELEEIGLKCAAVFGESNKEGHEKEYVQNNMETYSNASEFLHDRKDDLEALDNTCLVRSRMSLNEKERNPCSSLKMTSNDKETKKGKKSRMCPLYVRCGAHNKYRKMIEADVWIGTYEAFLSSSLPYQWDKYKRTMLEIAMLWSDVIFLDEADESQVRIDKNFIDELKITKDKLQDERDFFADNLIELNKKLYKSRTEKQNILRFTRYVGDMQQTVQYIYGSMLGKDNLIQKVLHSKTFTPYSLLYQWGYKYMDKSLSKEKVDAIVESIRRLLTSKDKEQKEVTRILRESFTEAHMLLNAKDIKTLSQAKTKVSEEILVEQLPKICDTDIPLKEIQADEKMKRNRMFEFILFFYHLHNLIAYLRSMYAQFVTEAQVMGVSPTVNMAFAYSPNRHSLYLPQAYTDTIHAFSLVNKGNHNNPDYLLELVEYCGSGRDLMLKMNDIFGDVEVTQEPAIVLLSATSVAPWSTYFDIEEKPKWLLLNRNQVNQKIDVSVDVFYDGKHAIKTSSVDLGTRKKHHVLLTKKMVRTGYLDNLRKDAEEDAVKALHQLEEQVRQAKGKEKVEKVKALRKAQKETKPMVAIAAPSYELAELITHTLFDEGYSETDVCTLYTSQKYLNDQEIKKKSYHIPRNEVHLLYKRSAKVFVFVWSALARGFNILRGPESNQSLLRHIVFTTRPYPIPDEFEDIVMFVHGEKEKIKRMVSRQNVTGYDALINMRRVSHTKMNAMFKKGVLWRNFEENEETNTHDKLAVASNQLISIHQTTGRGMRGGTDVSVHFADANMIPLTVNEKAVDIIDTKDSSMFGAMREVLLSGDTELHEALYGKIKEGFLNAQVRYF